jgi:LysR family transcriptional regulator for metE and metH
VNQIHKIKEGYEFRMKMHIEFRHLRTVKAIHESGGVSNAADILNITQSALSHQIKNLEEQTGIELFVRKSKPFAPDGGGYASVAVG